MMDPCSLFHTLSIEWRHSRTAVDPALRRTSSPKFTHLTVPLTHSLIAFNQVNLTAPSEPVRAGRHVRGPLTVPMTVVDSTAGLVLQLQPLGHELCHAGQRQVLPFGSLVLPVLVLLSLRLATGADEHDVHDGSLSPIATFPSQNVPSFA